MMRNSYTLRGRPQYVLTRVLLQKKMMIMNEKKKSPKVMDIS